MANVFRMPSAIATTRRCSFAVKDVAERIGRMPIAVHAHRSDLGIPSFFQRRPPRRSPHWTPEKEKLLGTMSDVGLAWTFGG